MKLATSLLTCMRCGDSKPLYGAVEFKCHCGGLYDVTHTWDHLQEYSPLQLRQIFDARARPLAHNGPMTRSGVWRFQELVMPSLLPENIVSLGENATILPAGDRLREWVGGDLDLWVIFEGLTMTGSFKDFGGTAHVSVSKQSGVKALICASTGDTSAMAAAYAAPAGISCVVVLPRDDVSPVQLMQPLMHGAKVILVPGSFDECMRIVRELVEQKRAFPINSLHPARIEGHQATVFLAAQFFGWELPDLFVVPVGNGSNTSSIGKGSRLLKNLGFVPRDERGRIISVQSTAADPLSSAWEKVQENGVADPSKWAAAYRPRQHLGKTTATAALIGNPVSCEKVMREINHSRGAILTAREEDLNHAVMVAGSDGFCVCPQTGTALAGLRQAVSRGFVKKGSRVAVVSTATGLKFPEVVRKQSEGLGLTQEAKTCSTEEVANLIGV